MGSKINALSSSIYPLAPVPRQFAPISRGLILDTILETCANQDGHLTGWVNKPRRGPIRTVLATLRSPAKANGLE